MGAGGEEGKVKAMLQQYITIEGARVHNLKDISVRIPRGTRLGILLTKRPCCDTFSLS